MNRRFLVGIKNSTEDYTLKQWTQLWKGKKIRPTRIKIHSNLEQLFKASSGQNYDDEMNLFCNFFADDFCRELEVQLKTFRQF